MFGFCSVLFLCVMVYFAFIKDTDHNKYTKK